MKGIYSNSTKPKVTQTHNFAIQSNPRRFVTQICNSYQSISCTCESAKCQSTNSKREPQKSNRNHWFRKINMSRMKGFPNMVFYHSRSKQLNFLLPPTLQKCTTIIQLTIQVKWKVEKNRNLPICIRISEADGNKDTIL